MYTNPLANRQRGTLAIENSPDRRRYGTTLAVSQQQIKSYHYDGQCFANQLTDFENWSPVLNSTTEDQKYIILTTNNQETDDSPMRTPLNASDN